MGVYGGVFGEIYDKVDPRVTPIFFQIFRVHQILIAHLRGIYLHLKLITNKLIMAVHFPHDFLQLKKIMLNDLYVILIYIFVQIYCDWLEYKWIMGAHAI